MTRAVVWGDAMRDEYLVGSVTRLSPEAPVPVLVPHEKLEANGGAGNVADHCHAFGWETTLLSRDCWPVKTRFLDASGHHLLRMDRDYPDAPAWDDWRALEDALTGADVLLVSDYHKGTVPDRLPILRRPRWVLADAKRGLARYADRVDVLKVNAPSWEAEGPVYGSLATVVTHGADGARVHWRGGAVDTVAGHRVPVGDVTGAGDTFLAWLARGLVEGQDFLDAVALANRAAAVAVQGRGTTVVGAL